ncbi:Reticulon-domain-containing protein [Peziza echinospora]|nr:Reticulon-domain-containing protein [Peziza echinospora]
MSEHDHIIHDINTDINAAAKNAVNGTQHDFRGLNDARHGLDNNAQDNRPEEHLTHFHSFFYDLVTWKFPRATSFIFLSILSTIFAFRFINVLRYVFKAAYLLLGSVAALEYAGKPLGYKGVVSQMRPRRYYTISRSSLESVFEELHDFLNFVVVEFQRVVFVENVFTTVVSFVFSFFGYFLIKYLPLWSLAFITTIMVFTGPYIYINNQDAIDAQIAHYSDFANHKLIEARGLGEQYAGEAVIRARETAFQLSDKVQNYTTRRPAATAEKTELNANNFPSVPATEPLLQEYRQQEPINTA